MAALIISDDTVQAVFGKKSVHPWGRLLAKMPGCLPRIFGYGQLPNSRLFRDVMDTIPRSKWAELINNQNPFRYREAIDSALSIHNQGSTNYCWCHSVAKAYENLRFLHGFAPSRISSASIGVPLTHGRNVGGYPEKAIMQLQSEGACSLDLWPDQVLEAPDDLVRLAQEQKQNRILYWIELNSWEEQITCGLLGIPVVLPLNWWRHAVCQGAPTIDSNNQIVVGFWNSWGDSFGDRGYAYLDEKRGTAEEGAFAPYLERYVP